MLILGISCYFHDAAAALIQDGSLVAAAEEERFSRKKHDYDFPQRAINFCLQFAGVKGKELDYVVFFEKPFPKFDRLLRTSIYGFPKTHGLMVQSLRSWLFDKLWIKSHICRYLGIDPKRVLFSEHHLSHAASAYLCSPFHDSAILTIDGVGEWTTASIGVGRAGKIELTHQLYFPHSLGLLYSAFTAFLGFEVNEGEYKVMGMAPYGSPRFVDEIYKIVLQHGDGSLWLDPKYFPFHYSTRRAFTDRFVKLFGAPRDPKIPFFTHTSGFPFYYGTRPHNFNELCAYNQRYADIAASIQLVTEEIILKLAREAHRLTGMNQLCLAGGVALNSVANGRLLRETPFKELYIQPSAGDGGGALGAALLAWNCILGNSQRFVMNRACWGQSYDHSEVAAAVSKVGAKALKYEGDQLIDQTVQRLLDGKVVGWFQGRFEWGPRALGQRSILADPRRADMKDLVNSKVKFREPFRPFAPSVTLEATERYFDLPCPETHLPARFMLLVTPVKKDREGEIPAVNHLGTARIQVVDSSDVLYYSLIHRFGEATGVPVVLNTSFNVRGEPIVNSPEDALRTFSISGIDTLVMGNYILDKP
jgi:carbamoyltransferase